MVIAQLPIYRGEKERSGERRRDVDVGRRDGEEMMCTSCTQLIPTAERNTCSPPRIYLFVGVPIFRPAMPASMRDGLFRGKAGQQAERPTGVTPFQRVSSVLGKESRRNDTAPCVMREIRVSPIMRSVDFCVPPAETFTGIHARAETVCGVKMHGKSSYTPFQPVLGGRAHARSLVGVSQLTAEDRVARARDVIP